MSPAGDNEQCFRELKGSVGDPWAVESVPLPESASYRSDGICLMRNEKADWSLQRQTLDQSYIPGDGNASYPGLQVETTEFTEIHGRDEYSDARDLQFVANNPVRECHVGLVPAGVRAPSVARAATPPDPSTTIRATGSSTDTPNDHMNHNFPHSPLYLFLPRLFSSRGEGSDYLAARRCDYHDP
ncbi:hypothetical protein H4582DRAFT_203499 [Lactarius indigo]|nr:hypothetical protein H4582DRAFT_203499 [Lactarius indigo]